MMFKQAFTSILNKYSYELLVIFCVIITYVVYTPGLVGGYVFDDKVNLKNIEVFYKNEGFDAFIKFIMSNMSGALKRPISTLSFLLNTDSWPANPYPFKLTNLFIHLFNGFLLYIVVLKLLRQYKIKGNLKLISLINMSFWLLNPYLVSTTLYIIQRMTMLPLTFTLIGVYLYLLAREKFESNKCLQGKVFLFFGSFVCTLFATLSKENGMILPFILLLIESYFLKIHGGFKLKQKDKMFFLVFPAAVIFIGFIYKIPDFINGYNIRDFSLVERIITEPRVLMTYLYHLFIPNYLTESVFTDGFSISESLFEPVTTILSFMAIIVMIFWSLFFKNKYPIMSLAILFFLITLVIESTIVPLEIYYEHRSYLPSVFIFLPISVLLSQLVQRTKLIYLVIIIFFIYMGFTTFLRSSLWSNSSKLITLTSNKYPNSIRAFTRKVSNIYTLGYTDLSITLLESYIKEYNGLSLKLNLINIRCSKGKLYKTEFDDLLVSINKVPFKKDDRSALIAFFNLLSENDCIDNPLIYYRKIIEALKTNKGYQNPLVRSIISYHDALLTLKEGNYNKSFLMLMKHVEEYQNFESVIFASKILITKGKYSMAETLLLKIINYKNINRYIDYDYKKESLMLINEIKKLK